MSREIETDGFITRAEDLKGSEPKKGSEPTIGDWIITLKSKKPLPPPYGEVVITDEGVVIMCKGTYKMLSEGKEF